MIVDTKKSDTVEENNRRAERLFELMKVNLIPWIRDLLKENEMQPSDIEKMFDKKKRMISNAMRGDYQPSIQFYIKMGIVLDKSPGEVLDSVILYEQKNNIKKTICKLMICINLPIVFVFNKFIYSLISHLIL